MKNRSLVNSLLILSLVLNFVIIGLYIKYRPKTAAAEMKPAGAFIETTATAKTGPKVMIDSGAFDFSDTKLSDEAWKIPAPDTSPTPAPDAPLNVEIK
jgi:hypothetical protein